jgi:hypothetical protein
MSNKWFAESAEDASQWAKKFNGFDGEAYFTLKVDISTSLYNRMMRNPRLDGIGPAVSADGELLQQINELGVIRVLNGSVLP